MSSFFFLIVYLRLKVTRYNKFAINTISTILSSETGKKRKTPGYPNVTISVASDSGERGIKPIPIVAATSNFSNSQKILIGYGGSPTLCFENIVSTMCIFASIENLI